jgi:protein-S-isoprenylcysteine O-methyltransferase Ste14
VELNGKNLSGLATAIAVIAIVLLYQNHGLFSTNVLVIVVQLAAVVLMIWARVTMGMKSFHYTANPVAGALVTSGPYRYWRHPIYAALLFFTWAGIVANLSAANLLLGFIVSVMLFARMVFEEKLLVERFPEYAEYARRTKRVVPGLF